MLRVGRRQLLHVGYKERHLEKGISPVVENKETCHHSRIKSLGGLPEMTETRAGKRIKSKNISNDSAISHELPMFKGSLSDSKEKPSMERKGSEIA